MIMSSRKAPEEVASARVKEEEYEYDTDDDGIEKPKSKRPRKEGAEFLDQLLGANTDEIANAGRSDGSLLARLEDFSSRLQASVCAVRKEVDENEMKRKADSARKAREEKTKLRKQLKAEKRCFLCKVVSQGQLHHCVEYKHNGGVSGDGVLACDNCYADVAKNTEDCSLCQSFHHRELGKGFCCGWDPKCKSFPYAKKTYTCRNCEELFCIECAQETTSGRPHLDDNWYCDECCYETIANITCSKCGELEGNYGNNPVFSLSADERVCRKCDPDY